MMNSNGVILSIPPIINRMNTKMTISTKNVFTSLWYYPNFSSIDYRWENIYYLQYNESSNEQSETENELYIHTYIGKVKVKVFTNKRYYDEEKRKYINKSYNIFEININKKNNYSNNNLNEINKSIKNSNDNLSNNLFYFYSTK